MLKYNQAVNQTGTINVIVKNNKLKTNKLFSFGSKHFLQSTIYNHQSAFTIVELLVVIVVIGILATITMVSYTGITQKATEALLQSDLSNSRKALQHYQATYGSYPTALDSNNCPSAPTPDTDPTFCLKPSSSNSYTTYISDGDYFGLELASPKNAIYSITDTTASKLGALTLSEAKADPANWITIGTQVWAKYNLNVGTMVPGTLGAGNTTNQTNDSKIEKYCYENNPAYCETDGGLYQWNEAMNYSITEKARGTCPIGSHIPSDAEWTVLINYLGPASAGTKMKPGGSSGLNMPIAGKLYLD